ncbi:MAG TPA: 30S ribosomal protein S12 methylthiotransferase RimO [Sporichthya sp.]|nr:30S ribosomal protein S12 methylthiotransferase RimO [Sporichthya sp.]
MTPRSRRPRPADAGPRPSAARRRRTPRAEPLPAAPTVALVTLGCQRNEVDSEELAGRLAADGWTLTAEAEDADVVMVNTCGFVEAAKKDSIDTLLAAADLTDGGKPRAVVAVGCLAERYGAELASALPEATVLGFDDYGAISERLQAAMRGDTHTPHVPHDRRALLPISPVERQAPAALSAVEEISAWAGPGSGPRPVRTRLEGGPVAPLKLASGCDRRCTFCAIPSFRGAFVSRRPAELLAEAAWLAESGVRELVLVSENSTSYGKDLGELRLLELLLPRLAGVDGIERVRVNYLQPAEMRPTLIDALTGTPGVVPYFDLSFQHSSADVLRRMKRFGDTDRFLGLVAQIRERAPEAGIRTNVIVGFPGETEADLAELERFLVGARLDTVGVFGYSDEEGTEAAGFDGKLSEDEVRERVEHLSRLVEELTNARAEERIGETVRVLVEENDPFRYPGAEEHGEACAEGRSAHQAPEVDGSTILVGGSAEVAEPQVGSFVTATVVATDGVDLIAVLDAPGLDGD